MEYFVLTLTYGIPGSMQRCEDWDEAKRRAVQLAAANNIDSDLIREYIEEDDIAPGYSTPDLSFGVYVLAAD